MAFNQATTKRYADYQRIYVTYSPMLLRFAEKYVSLPTAEDLVHDTFLKLWDKQLLVLPENDLKNLLYATVRNACIDHLRKQKFENETLDSRSVQLKLEELAFFKDAEVVFMRKDLIEYIMEKVAKLTERQQQIFKMAYIEGMKSAEIAVELHLSPRTVENQLYRIVLNLRQQLEEHLFLFLLLFLNG